MADVQDNNVQATDATVNTESQQEPQVQPNVTVKNTGSTIQVNQNPVTMDDVTDPTAPATEPNTDVQPQQDTPEAVQTNIDTQIKTEGDLKTELQTKGVDFDALAKEFDNDGELSQASLDALDKAGYPKSVVDAYINGMQATVDKFVGQVQGFAGGSEGYGQLVKFMESQPVAIRESFNATLNTGNLGQIQLAINGIKAQMTAKYGTANPTIMAGANAGNVVTGFANTQDMVKAMSDPRYQTDPKYTRDVIAKVKNAAFFRK
ncbi:capsid assembly protein [Pectinatus frisingensis]|uniref:capsid assembly protein n=1 Tax=Pectinatus frisingensis TaxID=865 RepID=UPI0018C5BC01|nr:hypothetical protein [Pectinatus frisingensis]